MAEGRPKGEMITMIKKKGTSMRDSEMRERSRVKVGDESRRERLIFNKGDLGRTNFRTIPNRSSVQPLN